MDFGPGPLPDAFSLIVRRSVADTPPPGLVVDDLDDWVLPRRVRVQGPLAMVADALAGEVRPFGTDAADSPPSVFYDDTRSPPSIVVTPRSRYGWTVGSDLDGLALAAATVRGLSLPLRAPAVPTVDFDARRPELEQVRRVADAYAAAPGRAPLPMLVLDTWQWDRSVPDSHPWLRDAERYARSTAGSGQATAILLSSGTAALLAPRWPLARHPAAAFRATVPSGLSLAVPASACNRHPALAATAWTFSFDGRGVLPPPSALLRLSAGPSAPDADAVSDMTPALAFDVAPGHHVVVRLLTPSGDSVSLWIRVRLRVAA